MSHLRNQITILLQIYGIFLQIQSTFMLNLNNTTRNAKFWPVGFVRFKNDVCQTLEGYDGTCYTRKHCQSLNGFNSGSCANGIGACCLFQGTCGGSSPNNNTYFVNPDFPNPLTGSTSCTFTIQQCNSDICQVRIDFLSLTLAQPDGNGNCIYDYLIITGGASTIPIICGENSGQHIYINFNGNSDIVIMISTRAAASLGRSWNIKITQLACDCPGLAPVGCLMYYTELSGTVKSFNYGTTLSGEFIDIGGGVLRSGTRQLVNQNYGVCIQMVPGYCSIEWSQGSDSTSFTVSDNTALAEVFPGLPSGPLVGENCTTDYVVIPNPYYTNNMAVNADRFCGNQFRTVRTTSKPFVLTVVNDGDDLPDRSNRGFSLDYTQLPCSSTNDLFFVK